MGTNAVTKIDELSNLSPAQVGNLFDQRIKTLEDLSEKINEVQKRCKKAEEEVEFAADCDFKGIIWDDQTKAIEYLQDACVALANSQISIQEALHLFFQYQILTTNMINQLVFACSNNLESMQVLQERVDRYIKTQNKRNDVMDQIIPSLLDLRIRLQQDSEKLQLMYDMRNKMQIAGVQTKGLSGNKELSLSGGNQGNGSNTTAIAIGVIALLISIAAVLGVRFN